MKLLPFTAGPRQGFFWHAPFHVVLNFLVNEKSVYPFSFKLKGPSLLIKALNLLQKS